MRLLLIVVGVCAAIGWAAPAPAEPDAGEPPGAAAAAGDNGAFLDSLRAAGITYTSPEHAVTAARAVCGLVDRGETGLEVVADLKAHNPGFTTDSAARFAAIAANIYCPHQLAAK